MGAMYERERFATNTVVIVKVVVTQAVTFSVACRGNQLRPDLLTDSELLANEVSNLERRPIDQQSAPAPDPHIGHRIRSECLGDLDHDVGLYISIRSDAPCRTY
jgi:hypothetical protein